MRDRAADTWRVPGASYQLRPVDNDTEHRQLLMQKLVEEVGEVITAQNNPDMDRWNGELVAELGDVLSVIKAIATVNNITWQAVGDASTARFIESGGFVEGVVWDTDR